MAIDVGFPPVARADAVALILGSLPGPESLRRREYYGFPYNRFWWIMGELAGARPELPYKERLDRLMRLGIALWDSCAAAERPGSLDQSIVPDSVTPNDFAPFLLAHRGIRRIFCNGTKSFELYRRLVVPGLPPALAAIPVERLPSTSPAHAGMTAAEKLERWRAAIGLLLL